jgi:hypothetical protein
LNAGLVNRETLRSRVDDLPIDSGQRQRIQSRLASLAVRPL